jgi:SAM-dependent methyltransferase
MKKRLLDFLACTTCGSEFVSIAAEETDGEVAQGKLVCSGCGMVVPIENFIPRFVGLSYADSFGFEWNRFHDVQIDILNNTKESEITLTEKTAFTQSDLKGKVVLDAGVGAGRFAEVVTRWGGEVVGVDITSAVDAAFRNIGKRNNVHVIQSDIFQLPFKRELFDCIYSIGVLHHTPDTKQAFQALVPYLKKGGQLAVYVYEKSQFHKFSDFWRRVSVRMSIKTLYYLSLLAVPAYYLCKIPLIGPRIHFWFPTSMHQNWRYRWLDTFDWYAPRYQWKHSIEEVVEWYTECGFVDIAVMPFPVCVRGTKA